MQALRRNYLIISLAFSGQIILNSQTAYYTNLQQELNTTYQISGGQYVVGGDESLIEQAVYISVNPIFHNPTNQSFTKSVQLSVPTPGPNPWSQLANFVSSTSVNQGDVLLLSCWVRNHNPAGDGKFALLFQELASPFRNSIYQELTVPNTNDWYQVFFPFMASINHPGGQAMVQLHLGLDAIDIEIAGIAVLNYRQKYQLSDLPNQGVLYYEGIEADAPWRAAAQARIETHRKANITINITNQNGQPLSGATIQAVLTEPAFGFGSFDEGRQLVSSVGDNTFYTKEFFRLFNYGTIGIYWSITEMDNYAASVASAQLMKNNGLKVRAHPVLWGVVPGQFRSMAEDVLIALQNGDAAYVRNRIDQRIEEVGNLFGTLVDDFDVLNEPTHVTNFQDLLGVSEEAQWFHKMKTKLPNNNSFINDYEILSLGAQDAPVQAYKDVITRLLQQNVPLDGVGFQAHMFDVPTPPEKVYQVMEEFAQLGQSFGKTFDLKITEYDHIGMSDQLSVQYMIDFMTAVFSHPQASSFTMWGFWDGSHWQNDAPFYRTDWTPKPALAAYQNLIFNEWWTNETVASNTAGQGSIRGFKGTYAIAINYQGATQAQQIQLNSDQNLNFSFTTSAMCEGGMVFGNGDQSTIITCPGDASADVVTFSTNSETALNYAYLITDANDNVLALEAANHDFNTAPPGLCLVYGVSYEGELVINFGQNISTVTSSTGCLDLSDNFISVYREVPNGATITTIDGQTEVTIILDDANPDIIAFENTASSTINYAYLLIDENDQILNISSANSFDLSNASPGICFVGGVAYTGNLIAQTGQNATEVAISDDCFSLSDNLVQINRINNNVVLDGGVVSTLDGSVSLNVCVGDGVSDNIEFTHTTTSSAQYTYVVTDENGVIIAIPSGNSVDFDNAPEGICFVGGVSYTGSITANAGDDLFNDAFSDGTFVISDDAVQINRIGVDGGTVRTLDGQEFVTVTVGDGIDDLVQVVHTTTSDADYVYLLTDDIDFILQILPANEFNFENAAPGVCFIVGLSYTGDLIAEPGDNINTDQLSNGCFELSNEAAVQITRIQQEVGVDGGDVTTSSGSETATVCLGDGSSNILEFNPSTSANLANYTLLVTDDAGNILGIPEGNMVDFSNTVAGVCTVGGLSYTGNLTAQVGDNISGTLSDGQFELSEGIVTVTRLDNSECATSIENLESQPISLAIIPNPVQTEFWLEFLSTSQSANLGQVEIFNMTGKLMAEIPVLIKTGHNRINLNASILSKGFYLVKIQIDNGVGYAKFIKG